MPGSGAPVESIFGKHTPARPSAAEVLALNALHTKSDATQSVLQSQSGAQYPTLPGPKLELPWYAHTLARRDGVLSAHSLVSPAVQRREQSARLADRLRHTPSQFGVLVSHDRPKPTLELSVA